MPCVGGALRSRLADPRAFPDPTVALRGSGARAGSTDAANDLAVLATGRIRRSHVLRIGSYSAGGGQPALTHALRTMRAMALVRWRAIAVARPVAVRPWTSVPAASQRTCRAHRRRRGLHSRARRPLSGAPAGVWTPV